MKTVGWTCFIRRWEYLGSVAESAAAAAPPHRINAPLIHLPMASPELPNPELPNRNSRAYLPLLATVLLIAGMLSWGLMPLGDPDSKILCFFYVLALVLGAWFLGRAMGRRAIWRLSPAAADLAVRRWQFTIREMLLGSVAFALLLGLITSSRPMSTTPFFKFHASNPDWGEHVIKSVCGKMGFPMADSRSGGGEQGGGRRKPGCIASITWIRPRPSAHAGGCGSGHGDRGILKQHGCRTAGGWREAAAADFHVDYDFERTQGDVEAYAVVRSGNRWGLQIVIHEWPQ